MSRAEKHAEVLLSLTTCSNGHRRSHRYGCSLLKKHPVDRHPHSCGDVMYHQSRPLCASDHHTDVQGTTDMKKRDEEMRRNERKRNEKNERRNEGRREAKKREERNSEETCVPVRRATTRHRQTGTLEVGWIHNLSSASLSGLAGSRT